MSPYCAKNLSILFDISTPNQRSIFQQSVLHEISLTLRIPTLSPSTLHKKKKKKRKESSFQALCLLSQMSKRKSNKNKGPAIIDLDLDSSDLDSPISELFRHEVSTHRSCWRHVFAYLIVQKEKLALKDIELIKKRYPCLLEFPCRFHRGERLKRKGKREYTKELRPPKDAKHAVSRKKEKLDSQAFDSKEKLGSEAFDRYFQNLWKNLSEDKRTSFTYLDCMWFSLYLQPSSRDKVLTWIKKKHIFSKKYVIVPIVCWSHWNLLIFCHFGESEQSETHKPCMLLLDSLENADPRRYEPDIRKFVLDIYKAEGRSETKDLIHRIPFLVPKVPQQRNDVECGNFVLYYINLFIEGAPENFSIEGGYPYFMTKNWFTPEGLECFCQQLYSSSE